ncbi:hypothetical protein VTI28DRAFT_1490 [Corynascus sepedonium]
MCMEALVSDKACSYTHTVGVEAVRFPSLGTHDPCKCYNVWLPVHWDRVSGQSLTRLHRWSKRLRPQLQITLTPRECMVCPSQSQVLVSPVFQG